MIKTTGHLQVGLNEREKSAFIDAVLRCAVSTFSDLRMRMETSQTFGRTDFSIHYKDTIICITETKKETIQEGVCQNILQLKDACKVIINFNSMSVWSN